MRKLASSILALLLTLLLGGILTATMVRLSPGFNSDEQLLDARLSGSSQRAIQSEHAAESGTPRFYFAYLAGMFQGDFGFSRSMGRPISDLLTTRLPVTAKLLSLGIAGSWLIGIVAAVMVAMGRNSGLRTVTSVLTGLLLSVPSALLAWMLFTYGGPVRLVIVLALLPKIFQYARNILLESRTLPHVLAAKAKGLSTSRLFLWHVVPSSLPQLLALAGVSLSMGFGAAIPIEVICDIPGVGQLAWKAALARDLPLLVSLTFLVLAVTQLGNLLSDCAITLFTRRTA